MEQLCNTHNSVSYNQFDFEDKYSSVSIIHRDFHFSDSQVIKRLAPRHKCHYSSFLE